MSDRNQKHAMSATERKRKQREDIDFRNKEKEKMRKRSEDIDFRNKEKERMRKRREDIDTRNKENEKRRKRHEDIDFRNKENEKKRKQREDFDFKNNEKDKMRIYVRNKRANGDYRMNEIQRRKKARLEATPNYPRTAELMHGDKKKIHAAHLARYRLKVKCCTGGRYTVESPFEYECQRLFRRYMVFDLKFTRYEKKAFFAFSG